MAHFFMARFGRDLPAYDLPAGVTIRTFAPGDEETFLRCCAGGELGTESWSLDDVREKLLGKPGVAPERVFFAEDAQGRAGATTTAVFEEGRGYVHMVAADPSFRGKGLGKAACYAAVRCLVDGLSDDSRYDLTARTPGNRLVRVVGDKSALGQFKEVKITGANKWSLFGELV